MEKFPECGSLILGCSSSLWAPVASLVPTIFLLASLQAMSLLKSKSPRDCDRHGADQLNSDKNNNSDWFRLETMDDSLQPTIDMLLNLSVFMWFGAVCPWSSFLNNDVIPIYRLIFLGVLILLVRRLPIVLAMHKWIHQIEHVRHAGFVGFFGPIGVGAIFYLSISREYLREITVDGEMRADVQKVYDTINVVVWFLVICSIVSPPLPPSSWGILSMRGLLFSFSDFMLCRLSMASPCPLEKRDIISRVPFLAPSVRALSMSPSRWPSTTPATPTARRCPKANSPFRDTAPASVTAERNHPSPLCYESVDRSSGLDLRASKSARSLLMSPHVR